MTKKSPEANSLNLYTPNTDPWKDRERAETGDDPRNDYQRDRDRILHCESFRKLQHKTQVFVVHEGDFFRTRLTHSLEVAQIGRGLASLLKLPQQSDQLVEAICLAHDLGHAPFGHAGEGTLNDLLENGWNSNAYSLEIVENIEPQYCERRGLNLTWATREGIARHETKYDRPSEDNKYTTYKQPSLEAQITSIADTIAVNTHDVEDALMAGILEIDNLHDLDIDFWERSRHQAEKEFNEAHPNGVWLGVDRKQLLNKRTRRHMINILIQDVEKEYRSRLEQSGVKTVKQLRKLEQPLIALSQATETQVDKLSVFMKDKVYKGPVLARQEFKARYLLTNLFNAFNEDKDSQKLLPLWTQERISKGNNRHLEIARYLASLTDRGATDLYMELFEPTERAMGHHIT